MSAFLPANPGVRGAEPEHPRLHQEPMSPAQRRARWEVRAAQWRARELAEHAKKEGKAANGAAVLAVMEEILARPEHKWQMAKPEGVAKPGAKPAAPKPAAKPAAPKPAAPKPAPKAAP